MREVMAGHVECGGLPGYITLLSRKGEVHVDMLGSATASAPIRRDTLFRIASMTKPIAAAAAMVLVEECKLRLDEPIEGYLPELANRRVLERVEGPLDKTVPARRSITLRDLLTFRLGFGMMSPSDQKYPIIAQAEELELGAMGLPNPSDCRHHPMSG